MNSTKRMKYITTCYSAILFSECNQHNDFKYLNPETAGWCQIGYNEQTEKWEACCFGESVSLKLKADPDVDKFKIEKMLNYL